MAFKQGLLFEKSKQLDKFTASKICKSVTKVFKPPSGNEFQIVNDVKKYARITYVFG